MAKNTTDTKTLQLIEEVKLRKKEIAKVEKPNWLTNCSITVENQLINLHVEKDVYKLINIAAFLKQREKAYEAISIELGVESPSFHFGGFKVCEWLEDIKTRINKIQIASKKEKLESLENRLSKIISPELQAKLELEAISAELM